MSAGLNLVSLLFALIYKVFNKAAIQFTVVRPVDVVYVDVVYNER
jgi:hypothetical protein